MIYQRVLYLTIFSQGFHQEAAQAKPIGQDDSRRGSEPWLD